MSLKVALASIYHALDYHGGNEVYTHNLAIALKVLGCNVTYFTSSIVSSPDYEIRTFPLTSISQRPIFSKSLVTQIVESKPKIFHFTGSGLPLVSSAFQIKNFNKITTIHTYQGPLNPTKLITRFGATVEQLMLSISTDRIITTTPTIESYVKKNFPNIPVKFIPMSLKPQFFMPGLDMRTSREKLKLPLQKKVILFIGRLDSNHYYKGVGDLITAITHLSMNYLLIIVGDGNTKINYQMQAQTLGVSSRVFFAGDVPEEQLIDYYSACDIFVLPSTSNSEGFGLVLLEAMSMGKPVISTTAIGSYQWFQEQKVVNFVTPHKPDELARMIDNVTYHPNLNMINKSRKFAKTFTTDKLAQQTVALYKSALK